MKYILTVIAAVFTLSACCATKCETKPAGKSVATDSCCKTGASCPKH